MQINEGISQQENIIIENQQSYNLTLDLVEWKPYYSLSKSSVGQIMYSFQRILNVIPKNIYEETLYEILKPLIENLVNEYCKILLCSSIVENNVKYYNLIGKMPTNVSICESEHGMIKLKKPKIGKMISALKQRISFILKREIPTLYLQNDEYLKEFNNMRIEIKNFEEIVNNFEQEFIEAIDAAHKAQQDNYY